MRGIVYPQAMSGAEFTLLRVGVLNSDLSSQRRAKAIELHARKVSSPFHQAMRGVRGRRRRRPRPSSWSSTPPTTDLNKLSCSSCVEVLPTHHSLSSMMDSPSYDFAFGARKASCIQVLYECTRVGFEASSQGPLTPISLSGGSLTLVLRNLTFSHQTTLDLCHFSLHRSHLSVFTHHF